MSGSESSADAEVRGGFTLTTDQTNQSVNKGNPLGRILNLLVEIVATAGTEAAPP